MKKTIYLLTTVFAIKSQPLFATYYDMEYWKEVHQTSKQGDHEAAYKLGVAWKEGNQGLKRSMYRSLLSHMYAYKKGNQRSLEKIMVHEDSYRNLSFHAIGDTESSGASLICFALYQYKGFAKSNGTDLEQNIMKARILFEEPINLERKRQIKSVETTSAHKKWLARAYMWLGIMLYREEISLKELSRPTWENLKCEKDSSSTEIAHTFLEKAVELGSHWASKYLKLAKKQLEITN